jgi:hypothetical protein
MRRGLGCVGGCVGARLRPGLAALCNASQSGEAAPTGQPRQAFLLVSVEGFSEEEAARILDVDASMLPSWWRRPAGSLRPNSRRTS